MRQEQQQTCAFTAAAYALEWCISDHRAGAMDLRKLAASIDGMFPKVIEDTFAFADQRDRAAGQLEWLREFAICAAIFNSEIMKFVDALKSGKTYEEAERGALPSERRRLLPFPTTRLAPVIAVLDAVKPARA